MELRLDDLRGPEIAQLLQEHLHDMAQHSPPESVHALDLEALRQPQISFWTLWEQGELLGCGALKALGGQQGEIKSMRTARGHLRKGVAATILQHILEVAAERGYQRLYLETGSMSAFAPAHRLYERFGFASCPPFAEYVEDRHSIFLCKTL